MKNLATILAFVFAFTFTTEAQKKRRKKMPKLTVTQHADLAIKKMTLALDLSDRQQKQIKPLLMAQIEAKEKEMAKRKEARENKEKPTADQIYAMKSKRLDNQIMMRNKMKDILNKEQFEQFKKMQKHRKKMALKKMKHKREKMGDRKMKRRRHIEDGE